MSPEWIQKYDTVLEEAEATVVNDPELLARVREARMPVWYIPVRLGYGTKEDRRDKANKLFAEMEKKDYWLFSEVYWDPSDGPAEKFKAWVEKALAKEETRLKQ